MATLPTSSVDISGGLAAQRQPSRTWHIVEDRIRGEADGLESVRQAVEIILHVERFRWQIYRPYSGMQWQGLIGQDSGYVTAELQRRIREALTMDDRVKGISDFECAMDVDELHCSFTVNTVYGDVKTGTEVTLPT